MHTLQELRIYLTSTPYALVRGHTGTEMEVTRELCSYWPAPLRLVAFRELEEKKSPTGSSIYDSYRKDLPGKIRPLLQKWLNCHGDDPVISGWI